METVLRKRILIFLAVLTDGFGAIGSGGPKPCGDNVKKMSSSHFLNTVSIWIWAPRPPIAPNPSVNKAKKMSTHFLSLG